MKFCKEESGELLRLKLGNSVTRGARGGSWESKDAAILQKIRVSDKGDSLIRHRREQKGSRNVTGPHNSISRIKRKKKWSLVLQIVCHFCFGIVLEWLL